MVGMAARATRGWMHPGYQRDTLRIDLFWFGRNRADPSLTWFVQLWELLRPFGYRLHWGKHQPRDPRLGAEHLRKVTPAGMTSWLPGHDSIPPPFSSRATGARRSGSRRERWNAGRATRPLLYAARVE